MYLVQGQKSEYKILLLRDKLTKEEYLNGQSQSEDFFYVMIMVINPCIIDMYTYTGTKGIPKR